MPILCYHAVDEAWRSPLALAPAVFDQHCAWLRAHRRVVSLADAANTMTDASRLPRGTAVLTFDDGFQGLYTDALPILLKHRLPATIFVVADTLTSTQRPVDWIDDPPTEPLKTLSRAQVLEMMSAGITVGSHSNTHRDLTALSEDECERDLRASREVLEDQLGVPIRWLAYPRGRHDERVRRAAARVGFTHGFALPEAPEPMSALAIPRVGIWSHDGLSALRVKTTNWYLALRSSRAYPLARAVRQLGRRRVAA